MLDAILQLMAKRSMVTVGEVATELSISAGLAEKLFFEGGIKFNMAGPSCPFHMQAKHAMETRPIG